MKMLLIFLWHLWTQEGCPIHIIASILIFSKVDQMKGKGVEDLYVELSEMHKLEQYSVEVRLKGRTLKSHRERNQGSPFLLKREQHQV